MRFLEVFNLWGLLFAAVLAAPHIIYARTHHGVTTSGFDNRAMVYIARAGRFFSLLLMAVNIGVLEQGFPEPKALMERFWLFTTAGLLVVYCLLWLVFFKTGSRAAALGVTLSSAAAVMLSGVLQVKTLLLTAGVVYLIGELYLSSQYFKRQ